MPVRKQSADDQVLGELIAIKKLIVLALIDGGMSQEQVSVALGIDRSQVSRLFPGGVPRSKRGK